MSGIFGVFNRNGEPVTRPLVDAMTDAMIEWGPDGQEVWHDGCTGLGQLLLHDTPEVQYEQLPRWVPEHSLAFTAEARIDNRDELCNLFDIPHPDRATTPDSDLILLAYLKWGEASPEHLFGDWSFAVWHPDEEHLFLARDHYGITSIYYYQDNARFAFAASRKALHAIDVPQRLNELYWAQVVIAWPAYHGERTIDLDIYRLPPAHAMRVTPTEMKVWQYWHLEDTPELRLPRFQDYVDGFLAVYREAVKARLRSVKPVGVTLSGGLDSGSVAALAAPELAQRGERLTAYTAVPLHPVDDFTPTQRRFGDEGALAGETAVFVGNIDHHLLTSEQQSLMSAMVVKQAIHQEPTHAAANFFWILEIMQRARQDNIGVLLTGQGGNAGVSWTGGRPASWRQKVLARLPKALQSKLIDWRLGPEPWIERAALNTAFTERINLRQAIQQEKVHPWLPVNTDARQQRFRIIKPGHSILGNLWAESSAFAGFSVRDPTIDIRVLSYCLSVPNEFYHGSEKGDNRWLIRAAMAGLLPDSVRLNRRRGLQAADNVTRLRQERDAVEEALALLHAGAAADYLDMARLEAVWQQIQQDVSIKATRQTNVVLLRGIAAGLYLNHRSAKRLFAGGGRD